VKRYKIVILPGDGIGPEVMESALSVLDVISRKYNFEIDLIYEVVGGKSIDQYGVPITDSVLQSCLDSDAVLLGAVGGVKWDSFPQEKKPEKGLLRLREVLGLYSNLRPAKIFKPLADASSLKSEIIIDCDIMVVRELTGGIYFGTPRGFDEKKGFNTLVYKKFEVERISKVAFEIAKTRKKKVVSVDKSNVLDSSQFWKNVVHEVHKDYTDVHLSNMYVDNAAMQLVQNPKQFDVIVTQNLFGDILSDITAMITGSLGMLPSASIGDNHAMYEPVHGTAPEIEGKNKANPIAMISSVGMMLEHTMKKFEASNDILNAIESVLQMGFRTPDIYSDGCQTVNNSKITSEIINFLEN
jgi:3-isopropylmalate dehydrogenase